MLYDSTKILLGTILRSVQDADQAKWHGRHEQIESCGDCLYEIHQMSRPRYQGFKMDAASKSANLLPMYERASRAIPYVKLMVRAIRREDQATAVENGKLALAEM
jgi:hypothetical protein